jgi:hypothetical protein
VKVDSTRADAARFDWPSMPRVATAAAGRQAAVAAVGIEPWQRARQAETSLQLNRDHSALQVAQLYLARLQKQAENTLQALDAPQAPPVEAARQGFMALLEQRAVLAGDYLDGRLQVRTGPPRTTFSLAGLESVAVVQAAGNETLLFSLGRHGHGPIAVVLDEHMGAARLVRRFNAGLAQAGIRVAAQPNGELRFSATEQDWLALKGHLRVQGEGPLFAKGAFVALRSREDSLQEQWQATVERRPLQALAMATVERIEASRARLRQHQADLRPAPDEQAMRESRSKMMDLATAIFRPGGGYAKVMSAAAAQANISRNAVVGLLTPADPLPTPR